MHLKALEDPLKRLEALGGHAEDLGGFAWEAPA